VAPSSPLEASGTTQPNDTASHHRRFQPSSWYKFTSNAEYSTMKMKAADFSKIMLNFYQTAQCHMPEEGILDKKHLVKCDWKFSW